MDNNSLFNEVIVSNGFLAIELNVITGYGSPSFLRKVVEVFPDLSINLFIGMSNEGISYEDHNQYRIIEEQTKIKIYYQRNDVLPPTHIKLLQFIYRNDEERIFIGSANFSENGFLRNREIMVKTSEIDTSLLFSWQKEHSVSCHSNEVEDLVNLYASEEDFHKDSPAIIEEIHEPIEGISSFENKIKSFKINKNKYDFMNQIYLWNQYEKIETPLVLPRKNDANFDVTGINAWIKGNKPYIKEGVVYRFRYFFPTDQVFKIFTDDGYCFEAKLNGRFGKELHFINVDIADYFINRLGKVSRNIVTNCDLQKYGRTKIVFYKINEETFILDFSLAI